MGKRNRKAIYKDTKVWKVLLFINLIGAGYPPRGRGKNVRNEYTGNNHSHSDGDHDGDHVIH